MTIPIIEHWFARFYVLTIVVTVVLGNAVDAHASHGRSSQFDMRYDAKTLISVVPESTINSVSGAGDVNGDGVDDFIIGTPYDGDGWTVGAAYVVFGSSSRKKVNLGKISSSTARPAIGFKIIGDSIKRNTGISVAGVKDVNGDGYDDVAVAAQAGPDQDGTDATVYVIYGGSNPASINLDSLPADRGFKMLLLHPGDDPTSFKSHITVGPAGDSNGDGLADVIVGAAYYDDDFEGDDYDNGSAFVVYGQRRRSSTNVWLYQMQNDEGFRINGDRLLDHAGMSVSSGDLNNDGLSDAVVGASGANSATGRAYVVFSRRDIGDVDLGDESTYNGFYMEGIYVGDNVGWSVAGAGDVNGDGIDDVIAGAPDADRGRGAAYVVYGTDAGGPDFDIDLEDLVPSQGFKVANRSNIRDGSRLGWSVAGAGDVNGDGIDDLIVGRPDGTNDEEDALVEARGYAYVLYGSPELRSEVNVLALARSEGFFLEGHPSEIPNTMGDHAGWDVDGVGDVNGDNRGDVIVSTFFEGGYASVTWRGQPTLSYRPLEAEVGRPVNHNPSSANPDAGIPKFTLAPDSKPLPAGLTIDKPTGRITGVPEAPAPSNTYTIRMQDLFSYVDAELPITVSCGNNC